MSNKPKASMLNIIYGTKCPKCNGKKVYTSKIDNHKVYCRDCHGLF